MDEKIYVLDRLSDCDKGNFAESKRVLLELHANSLTATDECAKLLEQIGGLFGDACEYDKYNGQLNEWLKGQPGSAAEQVKFLEQATLIGETAGTDLVAQAKISLNNACSVVARSYLLLRLSRDFMFGLTDLLRMRLTSAIGYLRLQAESLAILVLLRQHSSMAVDWLNSSDNGRAFYNKHHQKIVKKIKELDVYRYYEDGSNMSLHSRVMGVVSGIVIGKKSAPRGQIKLTYQEIDDPETLFLWFCVYLRAHKEIIEKLPEALPEVDFRQVDIRHYGEMVVSLWEKLQPMYIQKRRWPLLVMSGIPMGSGLLL